MSPRYANRMLPIIAVFLFLARAAIVFGQAPAAEGGPATPRRADVPSGPPQPVEPGYLGLVTDDRQEAGKGVRVTEAVASGPGAKGGLLAGDLITAIDGKAVHGNNEMAAALGSLPPGSQVAFEIDRNGQKQQINVTLGKRPAPAERRFEKFGPVTPMTETLPAPGDSDVRPPVAPGPAAGGPTLPGPPPEAPPASGPPATGAPSAGGPRPVPRTGVAESAEFPRADAARRPLLGVRTQTVTGEVRQRLRLAAASGALVVARTPGSPAEKAGIPLDAVIVAVNGTPVESPLDLARLVARAGSHSEIEISYVADGATRQTKVALDDAPAGRVAPGPVVRSNAPLPLAPAAQPDNITAPADDRGEVEALKRRVQELEQRVRDLEAAAKK
jgi:membrane-associated protease RseP (regulator of RpoE activity)